MYILRCRITLTKQVAWRGSGCSTHDVGCVVKAILPWWNVLLSEWVEPGPSLHLVHLVVVVLEEIPEEREHLLWTLVVHVSDASHALREGLGMGPGSKAPSYSAKHMYIQNTGRGKQCTFTTEQHTCI